MRLLIRHALRAELSGSLYLPTEEELRAELQRERELVERQIAESRADGHDGC